MFRGPVCFLSLSRRPSLTAPRAISSSLGARAFADSLDYVSVAIARRKLHLRIDAGRILAQQRLDQTDLSKKSCQSSVESRRMLVMMLPTVTCVAACRWCSA